MANYIKNEVLCEAYSRLNVPFSPSDDGVKRIKTEMLEFFTARAQFLFGEDVRVEIEFEEGSLITRLKVVGAAATVIISALGAYANFRESINYLTQDAALLAQSANLEMVFRTKAAHCDRVRVEKRKGVFGRVDELIGRLDVIKTEVLNSSLPRNQKAISGFTSATTEKLIEWESEVHRLFDKLDHDDTRACIAAGLLEELEKFPANVPWAAELSGGTFRATIATSDSEQAGLLAAAQTRYSVTVTKLRRNFENLVAQYAPKSA